MLRIFELDLFKHIFFLLSSAIMNLISIMDFFKKGNSHFFFPFKLCLLIQNDSRTTHKKKIWNCKESFLISSIHLKKLILICCLNYRSARIEFWKINFKAEKKKFHRQMLIKLIFFYLFLPLDFLQK